MARPRPFLLLLVGVAACRESELASEPPAPCPAVIGITVRPASATLAVGDSVQVIARVNTYQGSPCRAVELDGPFDWSVSDSTIARLRADSGWVLAMGSGQAVVTATWREERNFRAGAQITVTR
jgi:uncharacterized protein YjdB